MADEEHLVKGEITGEQLSAAPAEAPRKAPYVKPRLYIKRSGFSLGVFLKNNKRFYPLAIPMLVCFVYYVVMTVGGVNPIDDDASAYWEWGAGERDSIYVDGEWWRLVTNVFAHAGWVHLVGNMTTYAFGVHFLREVLSPWRVVAVFLVCGVVGSLVCSVTSNYVFLGASGGVLGLFGAFVGYALLEDDLFDRIKNNFYASLLVVGVNILSSFQVGVSLTIHLVGIITGFFIGCAIPLWKRRNLD